MNEGRKRQANGGDGRFVSYVLTLLSYSRRRHREARAVGGSERSERTTDVSDERGRQAAGPVPAVPSRRERR